MSVEDGATVANNVNTVSDRCVCCMRSDVAFIDLETCKHSGFFGRIFHYKTTLQLKYICWQCHHLLAKFVAFKSQVEKSIQYLNNIYIHKKDWNPPKRVQNLERSQTEVHYAVHSEPFILDNVKVEVKEEPTNHSVEIYVKEPSTNQHGGTVTADRLAGLIDTNDTVLPTQEEVILPIDIKVEFEEMDDEENVKFSETNIASNLHESTIEPSRSSEKSSEDKVALKFQVVTLSKNTYLMEKEKERTNESFLQLPYKCIECVVGFDREITLQNHMQTHHRKVTDSLPGPSFTRVFILQPNYLDLDKELNIKIEPDATNDNDDDIKQASSISQTDAAYAKMDSVCKVDETNSKVQEPNLNKDQGNGLHSNTVAKKQSVVSTNKRTAYNPTMEKKPDEPEDVTNKPLPSMSEPTEVQDAVASTLATPFAQPIITASKSKAQKQREYRQRIRASRTPAQAAAARKAKNERQRNNRLRQAIFPAIPVPMEVQEAVASTSATLFAEPTTAAPKTRAQIQREYRQRNAASKTPAQAAAAREARNVRDRNNRLRQAIAIGSLEATTTSSSYYTSQTEQ